MYVIPIHGIIGHPESKDDKRPYVSASSIAVHVNEAKKHGVAILDIASIGGYTDEAEKIKVLIQSANLVLHSKNSGDIASAATQIFLLASKENREYNPNKGVFLIHNPWTEMSGDANDLKNASKELATLENNYANDYVTATGADLTVIKTLMTEDKPLTPEQVEGLGFAKVTYSTIKAIAILKNKNMADNTVEQFGVIDKALLKIQASINSLIKPKALMLNDASGNEINFPEINSVDELVEGVKVEVGGEAYTGELTMQDGTVVTCDAGIVTGVAQPSADDAEALKVENEALKAEIESLKASAQVASDENKAMTETVAEVQAQMKEYSKLITKVKAQFSEGKPQGGTPPVGDPPKKKALSFKKSNRTL